jgi:hypothetical protein
MIANDFHSIRRTKLGTPFLFSVYRFVVVEKELRVSLKILLEMIPS